MTLRRKGSKYGAKKTSVDGITFHSKREAHWYGIYKIMEQAGEISQLVLQPPFKIVINDKKVCTYIADFAFRDKTGNLHVIDVKGMRTEVYRLKKKLVEAFYPHVRIEEIK